MGNSAAILDVESEVQMNLRATQAHGEPSAPAGPMKFTYASGTRPLAGYTIKRGIGRGGFGEVYYATSDAGKEVALKLIRRNLDIEIRGVTQCLNLKHPNLLGLFDIRKDDLDDSWVVMEYVNGECLEDCLQRHPNGVPLDAALAWFHGIAAGVSYLHDHGIVHRDLKPANIFCDDGVVKIGDYGLSKFISASRRSGQTESVGTVHYMAPEIGHGRYGKEIDIYALGIMLYEILTGHVPFDGESVGEVLMKHLTAEPDLSRLAEPYRTAVARTLHKDPEKRIKSVAELMSLLPAGPAPTLVNLQAVYRRAADDFVGAAGATNFDGKVNGQAPPAPGAANGAAASPAPDSVPPVYLLPFEPLAKSAKEGLRKGQEMWTNWKAPPAVKMLVLLIVGGAVVTNIGPMMIPIVVTMAILFVVYHFIREILAVCDPKTYGHLAHGRRGVVPPTPPPATTQGSATPEVQPFVARGYQASPRPSVVAATLAAQTAQAQAENFVQNKGRRRGSLDKTLPVLAPKTFRLRLMEATGSMLMAAGVAVVLGLVMVIFLRVSLDRDPSVEEFSWLTIVSVLGSWAVLVLGKFWEGREGDAARRRFLMLVVGLGLGVIAFGLKQLLYVPLKSDWPPPPAAENLNHKFFGPFGEPGLLGHAAYFGFMMMLVRWWRQSDPLRSTRLSIWRVIVTLFWNGVLIMFWPYPQPWGVMVAFMMSIAIQLSSPWQDPRGEPRLA